MAIQTQTKTPNNKLIQERANQIAHALSKFFNISEFPVFPIKIAYVKTTITLFNSDQPPRILLRRRDLVTCFEPVVSHENGHCLHYVVNPTIYSFLSQMPRTFAETLANGCELAWIEKQDPFLKYQSSISELARTSRIWRGYEHDSIFSNGMTHADLLGIGEEINERRRELGLI